MNPMLLVLSVAQMISVAVNPEKQEIAASGVDLPKASHWIFAGRYTGARILKDGGTEHIYGHGGETLFCWARRPRPGSKPRHISRKMAEMNFEIDYLSDIGDFRCSVTDSFSTTANN